MNYAGAGYLYAIRNTVNGNAYIGSTVNYKSRWSAHRSALRKGRHHSFILQKAWDKYGEPAFVFELLLVCPAEQRIAYENALMALEKYNVLRTAKESAVRGGWTHSEECKQKMSQAHRGKQFTQEHRLAISRARTGKKRDQAFRDKARARQVGVVPKQETRQKLSVALSGRKVSESTREKLRVARRAHNAATSEKFIKIVAEMAARVSGGSTVSRELAAHKMSSATYYKYVKLLPTKVAS